MKADSQSIARTSKQRPKKLKVIKLSYFLYAWTIFRDLGICGRIVHLLKALKNRPKWNEFWNQGYKFSNLLNDEGFGY